jgi:hypothetical protein
LSGRERKEEKREEGVMQDHWSQCFLEHDWGKQSPPLGDQRSLSQVTEDKVFISPPSISSQEKPMGKDFQMGEENHKRDILLFCLDDKLLPWELRADLTCSPKGKMTLILRIFLSLTKTILIREKTLSGM